MITLVYNSIMSCMKQVDVLDGLMIGFRLKIDATKKVNPKDLSSDQDLTIGIMNLISIEEHLMFSGAKTGKTSYFISCLSLFR